MLLMHWGLGISWDIYSTSKKECAIMTSTTTPNLPAPRTKTLPSNRENSQLEKRRLWSKSAVLHARIIARAPPKYPRLVNA